MFNVDLSLSFSLFYMFTLIAISLTVSGSGYKSLCLFKTDDATATTEKMK